MVNNFAPILVGTIALILGIKLLINALSAIKLANGGSDSWEETTGKVLKASYKEANFGSVKSKNPRSSTYLLDFEYEYKAHGKNHRSKKPLFYDLTLSDEITEFIDRYPEGKEVQVYYDPNDPDRAVLEKTMTGKNKTHNLALAIMLIAVGCILFAIRYQVIADFF